MQIANRQRSSEVKHPTLMVTTTDQMPMTSVMTSLGRRKCTTKCFKKQFLTLKLNEISRCF